MTGYGFSSRIAGRVGAFYVEATLSLLSAAPLLSLACRDGSDVAADAAGRAAREGIAPPCVTLCVTFAERTFTPALALAAGGSSALSTAAAEEGAAAGDSPVAAGSAGGRVPFMTNDDDAGAGSTTSS